MNCTGQPFTPPPWLMCSNASSADCAIFLVIGAMEPVSGSTPPTLTGQPCAAAWPANARLAAPRMSLNMEILPLRCLGSLMVRVPRNNCRLADEAARPEQEHEDEGEADQDHLHRRPLSGVGGGNELGDQGPGRRPDAPDHERPKERAAVVAAAADDEHRPHLEGHDRQEVE